MKNNVYKKSRFARVTGKRVSRGGIPNTVSKEGDGSFGLRITKNAVNDISGLNASDQKKAVAFFKRFNETQSTRLYESGQKLSGSLTAKVIKVDTNLRAVVTYDDKKKDGVLVLGVAHAGDRKAYDKAYNSFIDQVTTGEG